MSAYALALLRFLRIEGKRALEELDRFGETRPRSLRVKKLLTTHGQVDRVGIVGPLTQGAQALALMSSIPSELARPEANSTLSSPRSLRPPSSWSAHNCAPVSTETSCPLTEIVSPCAASCPGQCSADAEARARSVSH